MRLSDHLAVMREGSFVQVGSPHDIVLDPADDYVATFARDLDRSKLLTAGDVATRRIPIIAADVGPEAMREQVTRSGAPYAVLIDAAGRPSGYVSRDELGATLRRREVRSLPAATPLPDMYAALGANAPVAIVADDGTAIGAVDASDVIRRLGEPARAASASIGGVAGHSVRPS